MKKKKENLKKEFVENKNKGKKRTFEEIRIKNFENMDEETFVGIYNKETYETLKKSKTRKGYC